MCAEICIVIDIDRLFEGADHLAGLGRHRGQSNRIVRADTEIAVALFPAGEHRRRSRQVNDDIAAGLDPVLWVFKPQ